MKNNFKWIFIVLFFLLTDKYSTAQQTISGLIKDKTTGETLPGVNILLEGTLTGTVSDINGKFQLKTNQSYPFNLVFSYVGYKQQILSVSDSDAMEIILEDGAVIADEVVVTGSRVEEKVIQSAVAIEKMDLRGIKESASGSFYDAMENVKGVQMTTLSLGFKVPNTRGFTNTTNARFLQMIDGADSQAPGLGVSIANTVGPTELDVLSVEITPGASSSLYGMNALNGISNVQTKNPFYFKGLSVYQKTGANHVNDHFHELSLFTETSFRFANTIGNKWAYKLNGGFLKGTDWVAGNERDLNLDINSSTGLPAGYNPAYDGINSYGNESSNRKVINLGDGQRYEVRRTGYLEQDLVTNDYNVDNLKFDAGIYFRPNEKTELNYTYRIGKSDAIYQRGNRIRLDDYFIQQHKIEAKGKNWSARSYFTIEHTDKSYNIRPMGENMDKAFKGNSQWFNDYTTAFNSAYSSGNSSAASHDIARLTADAGRYEPGTDAYNDKLIELSKINNWDAGAQLLMDHKFSHSEFQYDFKDKIKWADFLVGADYRNFIIKPEGNSFINPDENNPTAIMNYDKFGAYAQITKKVLNDRLKLIGSIRGDKNKYFNAKFNPRLAAVFAVNENNYIRASFQNGYRFPTLFEGFSTVNNGGVIRFGGLEILSSDLHLFENSYVRASVDAFQKAVTADVNAGTPQDQAITDNAHLLEKNDYTYLQPEQIKAFDLGYKANLLEGKLYVEADVYYNLYKNFIDQIEISVPNTGTIGEMQNGVDSTVFTIYDNTQQTRYRMWTNSHSRYRNYGGSVSASWNFYKSFYLNGNLSVNLLGKVDDKDNYLETPFNTSPYIANVSISNREIYKNIGFTLTWRWQDGFEWKSPLANGIIPAYQTLDAQISFLFPKAFSTLKIGATNLLNHYYTQYEGGPSVGGFYYVAWTVDGLLSKGGKKRHEKNTDSGFDFLD